MSENKKNIKGGGRKKLYKKGTDTCTTRRRVIPKAEKENIEQAIDKIVEPYVNNN